ncbi:unnamed protein product [Ambrosiozyma monospora]|uniref:Unnamed protein product n=1 Tax=Ambrosiozyma monospora TaxID=43982 RepID=A0A9W6Z5V9_AMBMO|nr:unnamed protein product [Ambrosiozyma monospora]
MSDSKLPDQKAVYKQFYHYDFNSNKEYLSGLNEIQKQFLALRSESDVQIKKDIAEGKFDFNKIKPEEKNQLSLQAKVYFFCTQTNNILDLDDYLKWKASYNPSKDGANLSTSTTTTTTDKKTSDADADANANANPPYSSNYEELVDLIVNNKPIPGIKQIPDVTLDPNSASEHKLKERRKPWEKSTSASTTSEQQVADQ